MNGAWQAIIASAAGIVFTALARIVDRLLPDPSGKHPIPANPHTAAVVPPPVQPAHQPLPPPGTSQTVQPPPQPPNAAGH